MTRCRGKGRICTIPDETRHPALSGSETGKEEVNMVLRLIFTPRQEEMGAVSAAPD